ncbi:mannose-1-phosphate guanylyltransferase/mannose-6-phosphate isomerase [Alphaproteobacteria bacterium]|nr:mannose-1-phosphate guanylyltransferase/mannose-6-phosphate isomerase [Alphaproteobacteria bacterium]
MSIRSIILCGGSGTRLWPESRKSLPKQFIPILKNKSLLDLTLERMLCIEDQLKPIIVCNKQHGFLVKDSLKKYKLDASIILESEGKNTTAAIYLAAKFCAPNDKLIIMPSDHLITDNDQFHQDILHVKKHSNFLGWITLGITPTKASEAYGYIKVKKNNDNTMHKVLKFTEKPTKEIAQKFIEQKNYYWNSGIFLGKASMILNSIQYHAKNISYFCDKVVKESKISGNDEISFSPDLFTKIPKKSIDFSVMESEKNISLYPLNCKWSDVGSWDAVSEIFDKEQKEQNIIQVESSNNFIRSDKRLIATVGIKDLIIIDKDNATLIVKKNHSEKVKTVVNQLIEKDFSEGKEHTFEIRPWGKFENLLDTKLCKIKRIEVNPKKRLSLQYHNYRSEHWLIIDGTATIYLNGKIFDLSHGMSIDIPVKSKHYIENKYDKPLIIIETQLGSYFGEDDIIRLDDPYGR